MQVESIALVMHRSENMAAAFAHHIVRLESGGYALDAGKVLSATERDRVVEVLQGRDGSTKRFIPANVLAYDAESVLWYRPAGKAILGFRDGQREASVPALVFHIKESRLYVAALKKSERPDRDSDLCETGFPNVGKGGSWCSGGNRIPDEPMIGKTERYEQMFFESAFTHASTSRLKDVKDTLEFWMKQKANRPFNTKRLIPMGVTLSKWAGV